MSFTVITDTSANLPIEEIRAHDLKLIAFPYYFGEERHTCTDSSAFNGDEFYDKIRAGTVVTTSQITPQQYEEFFEEYLRGGSDVVYVCMSSGISGSCSSAGVAALSLREKYPDRRIEIVDTRGASLGEGLIALRAAELRDEGLGAKEAAAELEKAAETTFNIFTVDDLMHLKRGGRLSNFSAIVGTLLNIKPLLKGDEQGKIVSFAKVRGRKSAIRSLADHYDRLAVDPETQTVGIAQAGCREDAELLISLLKQNRPPKRILLVEYEPVTGSHVGPGALALFFTGPEGVRSTND